MKCIDKNNVHNGDYLIKILETTFGGVDTIVRWCTNCGAVVVDYEYDGKLMKSGIMRFPNELKDKPII